MAIVYEGRNVFLKRGIGVGLVGSVIWVFVMLGLIFFIDSWKLINVTIVTVLFTILIWGGTIGFIWNQANKEILFLKKFVRGRNGERVVLEELRKLSDKYTVLTDIRVRDRKGNVDLVVLGPSGIWAIEVKSHNGTISAKGSELLRNKRPFEKNVIKQTQSAALLIHDYLQEKLNLDIFVNPLLVMSDKLTILDPEIIKIGSVVVLSVNDMLRFLSETRSEHSYGEVVVNELKKMNTD